MHLQYLQPISFYVMQVNRAQEVVILSSKRQDRARLEGYLLRARI